MPRNVYFKNGKTTEQDLYEDIIIEAIKIYGYDVFYIPRKIVKRDGILTEDLISKFDSAFTIETYIESVDGFEGDGKFLSRFGLEIRDQVTLVVADRRWNQLVSRFGRVGTSTKPREGDLIYFPLTKGLFEIKFVEDKKPFFQLNDLVTYKLICELFEYESQEIDTGIPEVDSVQSDHSQGYKFKVEHQGSPPEVFGIGEDLTFTLPSNTSPSPTATAEMLRYETFEDYTTIFVGPITFNDSNNLSIPVGTIITLTNEERSAIAEVTYAYDLGDDDEDIFLNDVNVQNNEFAETSSMFIDWSETNPFGEPYNTNNP